MGGESRRSCSSRIEPIVGDDHFNSSIGKGDGEYEKSSERRAAWKRVIGVLFKTIGNVHFQVDLGSKGAKGVASSDTQPPLPRAYPNPRRIESRPRNEIENEPTLLKSRS